MRNTLYLLITSIILAALPRQARALQNVTFGWNPSPSPQITGYEIRYGLQSGQYPMQLAVGTNTSATVSSLVEGLTYYFVVVDFDASGIESRPSNEVTFTVPGLASPGEPWIQTDPANGGSMLLWNPSPSPNIVGYHVYYTGSQGGAQQLIYSGSATQFNLSNLTLSSNGNFTVAAYDASGQESAVTSAAAYMAGGNSPNPVLSLKRVETTGLLTAFSVAASGAIPTSWALQASSNLQTWGTITAASNSPVKVTVVVPSRSHLFFRLDSSLPGARMNMRTFPAAFSHAFSFFTSSSAAPAWTLQTSGDLQHWSNVTAGVGVAAHVAVVPAKTSALFLRLVKQ